MFHETFHIFMNDYKHFLFSWIFQLNIFHFQYSVNFSLREYLTNLLFIQKLMNSNMLKVS